MNTQKIQTGTVGTKGFTLVELIVVITILVILGTIAFLNLGGMSASARDSQRTSDLNQINQQVMVKQAKDGSPYASMITGTASTLSSPSIAGRTPTSTEYTAGNVNYSYLGIDSAKFSDPSPSAKGEAYKMGMTTLAGSAYQLAASLEEDNTALVMGTYRSRTAANATTASITLAATGSTLTIASTDIGKLRVGDTVTFNSGTATTITSMNAAGTSVTLAADQAPNSGVLALAANESTGLVGEEGNLATAVINDGTDLPYSLQQ